MGVDQRFENGGDERPGHPVVMAAVVVQCFPLRLIWMLDDAGFFGGVQSGERETHPSGAAGMDAVVISENRRTEALPENIIIAEEDMNDGGMVEHGTKIESWGKCRGKKDNGTDADPIGELCKCARDDAGAGAVGDQRDSGIRMRHAAIG